LKRLSQYLKRHIWLYIFGSSAMITAIVLDIFNPLLQRIIVDDVIIGGKIELFKWVILALAGITLGRAVLGYIKEYLFDLGSSKVILNLRKDLFDHIQTLSFQFFDGANTGELMSRIKEDADNVWKTTAFGLMVLIEQGIGFIVASVMLFTLNWKLALISLATMPFIAWTALRFQKKIGEVYGKISDQGVKLNTTAQENIAGVRLVKAFGREKHEIQKFLKQNKKNYELNQEQATVWAKFLPSMEFLANFSIVLVVGIGAVFVIQGEISLGTLVAFSNYIYFLIWPMRMLGWLTGIVAQSSASLKKIEKIFDEEPDIKSPINPIIPDIFKGHIEFRNVFFEYNGIPVLKNISFDARPGSTIGIMGITGAGKSSIINLIGRFYDSSAGDILIDETNVKELDLKTLRKHISVVMQDTFLFSDTLEENIKLGSVDFSEEDLISACRDAKIHDFVMHLPKGYQTVIGERGIGLSGGQKQRVSIARALARNSKVLILDDATSSLDMETEHQIQKAIENRKGLVKFIIAHRISAVKNADEILILEDGEIVERGNHTRLLELKGRYYETYCEQLHGFIDPDEDEEEEVV
jgi:ATP-binding cassette, subfamily B, multidrug efflux pump